jgi:hypothetical protein
VISAPVRAQERGQIGVVMEAPATFAVIFHPSNKVAIRPEVTLAHASTELVQLTLGDTITKANEWAVNVGASALFYAARWDRVHSYLSPGFTFGHASVDTSSGSDQRESSAKTFSGKASWGVQFVAARKFSVFGEMGYRLSRSKVPTESPIGTLTTTTWSGGSRGAVGIIFYFGRSE